MDSDFIKDIKSDVRRATISLGSNSLKSQPVKHTCERCDYLRLCSHGMTLQAKTMAAAGKKIPKV